MRSPKALVILNLLCTGIVIKGQRCQSQEAEFKKDAVLYESVRYGHYIELECCSQKESTVRWMKLNRDTSHWQNYIPDRNGVHLLESKQILSIQSAVFEDNGFYKCQKENGSDTVDMKQFKLNVIACDKLARGAYPVSPLPCPETVAREKERLTLPCKGYFGCGEEGDIRIAMWYVSVGTNDNWTEVSEADDRYTETKFEEDSGTVVGSNLTIKDVSDVDFNRKFMCLLVTPQLVKGQSSIFVTLKNSYKTDQGSVFLSGFNSGNVIIVLTVVVVMLLIVSVVSLGLCTHRKVFKDGKVTRRGEEEQWMTMTFKDIKDSRQMLP